MFLIKIDKEGNLTKIEENKDYEYLINILNSISEGLESKGIMLINKKTTTDLDVTYEFSSKENGWECVYLISNNLANNIKLI